MAIAAVKENRADMVAFGRPFISNPDLVERLRIDAPLAEGDRATYYGGGAERLHRLSLMEGRLMTDAELPVPAREPRRVDPRLLELLVCPVTRATLSYDSARQELVSRAAKLAYPIRDGVPIMLPEEARPLED